MAFSPTRPDRARLARVPFGDAWLALDSPRAGEMCDVLDVRVRLAMYRLLVESCAGFGAHDERSPFWGYASQLAWQHRSGRLGDPRGFAIDAASWWGACNYALSVVPYAFAAELGRVPALRFAAVPESYRVVRAVWRDAFAAMQAGDGDHARVALWRAHVASIAAACARHGADLAALPAEEQRFARGWIRMVDLFGAAAIRTDLELLVQDSGALPSRVLAAGDLADLPRAERSSARRVCALADRPSLRWRAELALWRRSMRSRSARAESSQLFTLFLGHTRSVRGGLRALAYATLPVFVLDSRAIRLTTRAWWNW
ncbi:MAG TPA: Leg1-related protein [Kofleriaceae bacterium]